MQHNLKSKQIKALRMLACGQSEFDITQALKLRRETLWRWKQMPEFAVELDRLTQQVRDGMRQRLLNLADTSIAAIEKQLKSSLGSNWKMVHAALDVLKLLGAGEVLVSNAPANAEISVTRIENMRMSAPVAIPGVREL